MDLETRPLQNINGVSQADLVSDLYYATPLISDREDKGINFSDDEEVLVFLLSLNI